MTEYAKHKLVKCVTCTKIFRTKRLNHIRCAACSKDVKLIARLRQAEEERTAKQAHLHVFMGDKGDTML